MIAFLFRTKRVDCNLTMTVRLQDRHTGRPLPGVLNSTVINFSAQGACLILPTLAINGKHLFYETLDSKTCNLLLIPEGRHCDTDEQSIAARSVWMDSCRHQDKPAFKIGIHFFDTQNILYELLKKHPSAA